MCKVVDVGFVQGRYKMWLNSFSGGRSLDPANHPMYKVKFTIPPIYNIDPKYTQSLIFVKSVWKGEQEAGTTDVFWTFFIEGKSLPHNFQSRTHLSGNSQSSNSKVICKFPQEAYYPIAGNPSASYHEYHGNVIDNGILVGDTFVNGGDITLTLIGNTGVPIADAMSLTNHYELEIDIQLVENTI